MPTAAFMATSTFATNYNNFVAYSSYLQQWAQSVQSMAVWLQADPNFATALSSEERSKVLSAQTTANNLLQALPVTVSAPSLG